MAKSYREILEEYQRASAFGFGGSLKDYTQRQNELYGNGEYNEGLRDGPWTRFSTRFDQELEGTGVPGLAGQALGEIAGTFGQREVGQQIGEGLPRSLVNMAPLLIPGAGWAAAAAGAVGSGALMGGQTYADTGSAPAALLSGTAGALMPAAGSLGAKVGLKAAGAPLFEGTLGVNAFGRQAGQEISERIATTGAERLAQYTGSQLAAVVPGAASAYGQQRILNPDQPFDVKAFAIETALSQIPFTAYDAVKMSRTPVTPKRELEGLLRTEAQQPVAPTSSAEPFAPRPTSQEEAAVREITLRRMAQVAGDSSKTPEEKAQALVEALNATNDVESTPAVRPLVQAVSEAPVTIFGRADKIKDSYRVLVDDIQTAAALNIEPGSTVFVNGVEPVLDPDSGKLKFDAKVDNIRPAKRALTEQDFGVRPTTWEEGVQPDLPVQPELAPVPRETIEAEAQRLGEQIEVVRQRRAARSQLDIVRPQVRLSIPETQALVDMGVKPSRVMRLPHGQKIPKTGNLVLDMFQGPITADTAGNVVRLGNTDVATDGWMNETRFLKTVGLPKELVPALKEMYPEAWGAKGVNATELVKALRERPMTEVRKLGGESSFDNREARIVHDLDTVWPTWRQDANGRLEDVAGPNPRAEELRQEYLAFSREVQDTPPSDDAEAKYSLLGPREAKDMPGYVEGLVRVRRRTKSVEEGLDAPIDDPYTGVYTRDEKGYSDVSHFIENPIYVGPHFGDPKNGGEDTNVLAFFRGYEETLPDGRKAFHVIEVQSDWAQSQRNAEKMLRGEMEMASESVAREDAAKQNPLLKSYETLALKAAIEHAREIGADVIVLSDGETAMMTEGHDKAADWQKTFSTKHEALEALGTLDVKYGSLELDERTVKVPSQLDLPISQLQEMGFTVMPTQSEGMRLHYDQTLPSTLSKLTGQKPTPVELPGIHKGAMSELSDAPAGSPVFRDKSGKAKTQITGRAFSLEKVNAGLSADATLSIKEAVMKFEQAEQREKQAREKIAKIPQTSEEAVQMLGLADVAKKITDLALAQGATAKQAWEAARLVGQGKELSAAMFDTEVQKAHVAKLTDQETETGMALIKMYTDAEAINPDSDAAELGATIRLALEQTVANPNYSQHVARTVARWRAGQYGDATPQQLRRSLQATTATARRPSTTPESYLVDGRRVTGTKEYLEKYIQDNDLASDGWKVLPNSRGREPYIGRPKKNVSLDQPTGDTDVGTLGNVIASARVAPSLDLSRIPISTNEELLTYVDGLIASPDDYAQSKHGEATSEDVLDTAETLSELRTALTNTLENGVPIPRELYDEIRFVMDYSRNMSRLVTLDSFIPGDHELARTAGLLEETPEKFFKFIASQKQRLGVIADFVEAQIPFADFSDLKLRLPGKPGWRPDGWSYADYAGLAPEINIPRLPDVESLDKFMMNAAHEFVHYNEHRLAMRDTPAAKEYMGKKMEVLDALRNSPALPKHVRELIKKSIAEKHWDRLEGPEQKDIIASWVKGLGKTPEYFNVVYGLQHPNELTAVLLSDPTAINLATRTKMPKNIVDTVLSVFSRAINKLFGGKTSTDNAFTTLVQSYDNFLTGGRLKHTYNGHSFIRSELLSRGVRPEALASRMETIDRVYTRGSLRDSIVGFVREGDNGLLPATAEYSGLKPEIRTALISGEPKVVGREVMGLLADEVPTYKELYQRMQQDIEIAEALAKNVKDGVVPGALPPLAAAELKLSKVKLNAMKRALDKQANAIAAWQATDGVTLEGWERGLRGALTGERMYAPPDMPEIDTVQELLGMPGKGRKMSFAEKNLYLTQHVKESHPALKAGVNTVAWEQANATYRATLLQNALIHNAEIAGENKLDPAILKTINRVADSEALNGAASDILRWQNKEGKALDVDWAAPFVRETMSRFNESDKKAIQTTVQAIKQRHWLWVDKVLPNALGQKNVADTAVLILSKESGMLPEDARSLSRELYDGLTKLVQPDTMQVGMEQLRVLSARMSPDTYMKALKHAQTVSARTQTAVAALRGRPGFVSESRYGSNHLVMEGPKGERLRVSNDNLKELQKIQSQKEREGYKFLDLVEAEDKANPRFGVREDLLQNLESLERENEQVLRQVLAGDVETLDKVLNLVKPSGSIRAAIAANMPLPNVPRRFVGGREYINMLDNSNQFYIRMNNWLKNRLTRSEAAVEMMHPEVAQNREYTRYLNQHVENFLTPDNAVARKIVEATYFWRLGADMGQALIEGTQQLTTGISELIAETGSVTDAFKIAARANKMFVEAKAGNGKFKDPEHERLADFLKSHGHAHLANWADVMDLDSGVVLAANRGFRADPVEAIKTGARKISTMVSRYNDQVTAHAAFDIARAQGKSFDEAAKFAVDVKMRGLYTSGKAGRSVGFWSIKSRPVPQLLGALQNYTLGWFGQMSQNFAKGFGKNPPAGLTPTQRAGARKAFVYSLVAQAALAGGLGLPGVGQGLALVHQATGFDLKGWIRRELASLFGEDEKYGGVMTGLAMRGVGAAGLPVDPSNRTSISVPFIGTDTYKGMQVGNFLGAPFNTAADLVQGLGKFLSGDVAGLAQLAPSALKRPLTLWQGEGDIRDKRGGLVMELGPYEKAVMALGLQPSRVSAARDTAEVVAKANDRAAAQKASLVDRIAERVRKGDIPAAQELLLEYKQEQPDVDMMELVRSVGNRVAAQQLPYDHRRDVNPAVSLAGIGSSVPSSEARRQAIGIETMRAFGITPRLNLHDSAEAIEVDRLMDSDPFLTRREALERVRGTGGIRRSRASLGLPEYLR